MRTETWDPVEHCWRPMPIERTPQRPRVMTGLFALLRHPPCWCTCKSCRVNGHCGSYPCTRKP